MRLRDFTIIFVVIFAAVTGLFLSPSTPFLSSAMLYGLMLSLFVSFIPLDFKVLAKTAWRHKNAILWYTFAHLLIFPSIAYGLFSYLAPDYAIAALLITGTAVASSAPFMAYIMGANTGLVTVLTVTTSFLLPLSLPFMVRVWAGAVIDIPFFDMMISLAKVILFPAIIAFGIQRFSPFLEIKIKKFGYPLGISAMYVSMTAAFAKYSAELIASPQLVWEGLGVAFIASFLLAFLGWASGLLFSRDMRLVYVISSVFVNSIIIVILGSEFFGSREAVVGICYLAPYYVLYPLLRFYVVYSAKQQHT